MEQSVQFFKTRDGVQIAYATLGEGRPLVYATRWPVHLQIEWGLRFIRDFLSESGGPVHADPLRPARRRAVRRRRSTFQVRGACGRFRGAG